MAKRFTTRNVRRTRGKQKLVWISSYGLNISTLFVAPGDPNPGLNASGAVLDIPLLIGSDWKIVNIQANEKAYLRRVICMYTVVYSVTGAFSPPPFITTALYITESDAAGVTETDAFGNTTGTPALVIDSEETIKTDSWGPGMNSTTAPNAALASNELYTRRMFWKGRRGLEGDEGVDLLIMASGQSAPSGGISSNVYSRCLVEIV